MTTFYVTYKQHGTLKRAVVNESRYKKLENDITIADLQFYPTQNLMEQAYAQERGLQSDTRKQLNG